jgi:hypothetical protein
MGRTHKIISYFMGKTKVKKKTIKFIDYFKKNSIIILLLLTISSIFLINLSGQDYSGDEPDTVIIGRSILMYGVPSAWDGKNLVSLGNGLDFKKINDLYIWVWHPWMQFYLVATGVALFGDTIGATRLPFAMFGIFTIILLYFVSQEIFKNKFISFLVSLHLVFLLPFFLYARNVRYYSPAAFFSLLTIFLLLRLWKGKWNTISSVLLFLSTFLLFHTNYLSWASTIPLLLITVLIKKNKTVLFITIFEILFALGWFLFFQPYGGNAGITGNRGVAVLVNIVHYVSYINSYIFSLILVTFLFFIRHHLGKFFFFLVGVILVKILFFSVFLYAHGRYLVELMPLFMLFFGFIYQYLIKKKYWFICIILFTTIISSNILNVVLQWPFKPTKTRIEYWLSHYKIELTGSYTTIMPQVGEYLQKNYQKGDLFWSNFLSYNYTKVPTISPLWDTSTNTLQGPQSITNLEKIRWFVIYSDKNDFLTTLLADVRFGKNWKEKLEKDYKRIIIPYDINTVVNNDGDIYNRQFPPGQVAQGRVIIYEKKTK